MPRRSFSDVVTVARRFRGALAVVAAVITIAASAPSFAADFDGGYWLPGVAQGYFIQGSTADAQTDNPNVTVDTSSAWSMVTNDCTSQSTCEFAQDGWLKNYYDSAPYYFYEYGGSSSSPNLFPGDPQPGSSAHAYTVVLTNPVWSGDTLQSGTWNFEVDYQTLYSTSTILFSPGGVEDMGEVHNTSDQSPGGYSTGAQIQFSSLEYNNPSGWQNVFGYMQLDGNSAPGDGPCGVTTNSTSNQYCYYSSSTFSIWDSRYST